MDLKNLNLNFTFDSHSSNSNDRVTETATNETTITPNNAQTTITSLPRLVAGNISP
jgi:hypothetical protein